MSIFDVPENYGKLPDKERNRLRKAWRALAAKEAPDQRAATPSGAPYPLRSWPPDAALDIQHLAEWADGRVSKAGDTMTNALALSAGNIVLSSPAGQGVHWPALNYFLWVSSDMLTVADGDLHPSYMQVGHLFLYHANGSMVLRAQTGQLEVMDATETAVTTVAHAPASYANQSMTLAQKTALDKLAAPMPADPVAALLELAKGINASTLSDAGVETIDDEDGHPVAVHHERLLALLIAAVAELAGGGS